MVHGRRATRNLKITEKLISDYYEALHLTDKKVFAVSAKALSDQLGAGYDTVDEIKRLADSLDLQARALNDMGIGSGLCRLHAMKFYQVAQMPVSLMKVGQHVVDELLGLLRDPWEARRVIETMLLPIVREYRLLDYFVPVRAQYAVVLAYCGEVEAAGRLIRELQSFDVSNFRRAELENQSRLIEKIAAEQIFLGTPTIEVDVPRVGRNERCPCGSGKKYKKCHGA